ncbi:MAG: hypothetical protein AB2L13_10610 [Spirochaetota bacterium]
MAEQEAGYTPVQIDAYQKASALKSRAGYMEKRVQELRAAAADIGNAADSGAAAEAIERIYNKVVQAPESTVPNFAQKYAGIIRRITDRLRMREEHKASLALFKEQRPDEVVDIDKLAKAVRNDEEMIHDYLQSLEALQGEAQAFPVEYLQSLKQAVDDATAKLAAAESKIADMQASLKSSVKAARTTVESGKSVARVKNRTLDAKVPGCDPILLFGQPPVANSLFRPTAPVEPGVHVDSPASATAAARPSRNPFSVLRGTRGL